MNSRPVNLDLRTVKMPFAAVLSILHRISGVIIFFAIPVLLWLLQASITSQEGFNQVNALLHNTFYRLIFFAILWAFGYHLMAGIKHLVMDIGYGETLTGARVSSTLIVFGNILLLICLGVSL